MSAYFGDLKNGALQGTLLSPVSISSTNTGTGVDMGLGNSNMCSAILIAGLYDVTSTSETYAFKIQESDDNSTNWTDVAGLDGPSFTSKTGVASANDGLAFTQTINFFRTKRYLRSVCTLGGVTPAIVLSIIVLEPKKIVGGAGYQA